MLRYVGVVDLEAGRGRVELRRYPKAHPFAQLSGTDNIISFTTKVRAVIMFSSKIVWSVKGGSVF